MVSHKKGIDKKLLFLAAQGFNLQVFFKFIWIKYICKFFLMYHLKDLGASR